jgi:hypothetical protein
MLLSIDILFLFSKVDYAPVSVSDTPRYNHRGLLIDTARHFEPIAALKRLIDGMTYAKMNVRRNKYTLLYFYFFIFPPSE